MVDLQSVMRQREAVRNVMFSYLMEQMVPFPFNREQMSSWASDIPRGGGECIIYTSYMYQMAGLFRKYEEMLPRFVQLGARSTWSRSAGFSSGQRRRTWTGPSGY
ncbi:hypothetical protein [Thermogymnomonas acidicola]|uniref:hypothetical protein n=1 Tax=Thermogymnomonas acidicola TaxID=399579 RepID=UPI001396B3BB|nr:hypothetical protein [Thermogymnomonas acidicola]